MAACAPAKSNDPITCASQALEPEVKQQEAAKKHPSPIKDVEPPVPSRENAVTLNVETTKVLGEDKDLAKPLANGGSTVKKGLTKTGKTHGQVRESWLGQNWEEQDCALALEIGCSRAIVGRWRKKLGATAPLRKWKHSSHAKSGHHKLAKYESLDWLKNDSTLARELGLSRERIRQMRILLAKPRSPDYGRHDRKPPDEKGVFRNPPLLPPSPSP